MTYGKNNIKLKIVVSVTLLIFTVVTIINGFAYLQVSKNIIKNKFELLDSLQHSKINELENWFGNLSNLLLSVSSLKMTVEAFEDFENSFYILDKEVEISDKILKKTLEKDLEHSYLTKINSNLKYIPAKKDILEYMPKEKSNLIAQYIYTLKWKDPLSTKSSYEKVHKSYHDSFSSFRKAYNIYDMFLIDKKGNLIYTNFKEKDFATNLFFGPYKDSGLANVFKKALNAKKGEVVFEDFSPYEPSFNSSASFLATPIFKDERFIGVFAFQLSITYLNKLMKFNNKYEDTGLGKTGETYLVGDDYKLRSDLRYIDKIDTMVGIKQIKTEKIEDIFKSDKVFETSVTKNYNGKEVLSKVHKINLPGNIKWLIVTEIETKEALKDAQDFEKNILFISMATLGAVGILLFLYFNKILSKLDDKEKKLQEINKKLKSKTLFIESIMDNTPVPIFYKDTQGTYKGVNKEFEKVFGFKKEDIVGKNVFDIAPKEIAQKYFQEDKEIFDHPFVKQIYDFVVKNPNNGKISNVVFHKKAYFDENGKVAGLIGAAIDVTKRRQYEKEIKEYSHQLSILNLHLEEKVKERTKELLNAQKLAKLGTWELDIENHLIKWCDEAYRIFEIDRNQYPKVYLKDFLDLIHIEDGLKFFDAYNEHLTNNGSYILVHRIKTKNGKIKYIEERCETKYDENNHPVLSRGTVQDITELKKVEDELHEKSQLLTRQSKLAQMGELISMIAHQWRQPLGSIGSAVVSIENKLSLERFDLSKPEEKDKFLSFLNNKLKNISGYIEFLSKTIDDFRNFYKNDKQKNKANIASVIRNVLKITNFSFKNKNINIELNLDENIEIYIYQNEFMQVLLNILKNSEDNFQEKELKNKKVEISLFQKNNKVILTVKDNGGGIPLYIMPEIFKPYFSTKEDKNGTGLGLYMSKMIIEEHHQGKLTAKNIKEGVEFIIELPLTN